MLPVGRASHVQPHEVLAPGQRLMMHKITNRNLLIGQLVDALLRNVVQIVEIRHQNVSWESTEGIEF